MLQTLLVFNPKIPNKKKDGTKNFHLIGLKLENRGVIPTIKSKPLMVQLLERIGGVEVVSGDDYIYRVNIPNVGPRGVKRNVYNKIRAFSSNPSAWFMYKNERIKILEANFIEGDFKPSIILNDNFHIGCKDGKICPTIIQREGKKPMKVDSFLRGFKFDINSQVNAKL